jgi:phosphomannomutase
VIAGDGVKYAFDSEGWLLHRLSGTEPMVRLYCEHRVDGTVASILAAAEERLRDFVRKRELTA